MPNRPLTGRERMGHAIAEALIRRGMSQAELTAEVGRRERGKPYSPGYALDWLRGTKKMSNEAIMAAEEVLELHPGTLSRHLGWVPADTAILTVEDAIASDVDLTPSARDAVLAAYRAALEQSARSRRRPAQTRGRGSQ